MTAMPRFRLAAPSVLPLASLAGALRVMLRRAGREADQTWSRFGWCRNVTPTAFWRATRKSLLRQNLPDASVSCGRGLGVT